MTTNASDTFDDKIIKSVFQTLELMAEERRKRLRAMGFEITQEDEKWIAANTVKSFTNLMKNRLRQQQELEQAEQEALG